VRGPKEAREERKAELSAASVGVHALRIDPGDTSEIVLRLKRREELAPSQGMRVRVDALVAGENGAGVGIVSSEVEVPASGKAVELRWAGGRWEPVG
jgi:hypothetical protein